MRLRAFFRPQQTEQALALQRLLGAERPQRRDLDFIAPLAFHGCLYLA